MTREEYNLLVVKNLHIRDSIESFEVPKTGKILTDKEEKGNIYVKGLFVCNHDEMSYGYDFEPSIITLDRDRKLVRTFNIAWEASAMWRYAFSKNFKKDEVIQMIKDSKTDVQYFKERIYTVNNYASDMAVEESIADELAKDFVEEFGYHSYPVIDNKEMGIVQQNSPNKTVMVNKVVADYIRKSTSISIMQIPDKVTLKEQFQQLLDDIESKLTDEETTRFSNLIMEL